MAVTGFGSLPVVSSWEFSRSKDVNPWFDSSQEGQNWETRNIDTPDTIVNPDNSDELLVLHSGREDGNSTEGGWDIGLKRIDLSTSVTSWSNDPSNPVYESSTGIGDPNFMYNSDGSPAKYQMWTWGEDSNGEDIVQYFEGSSIDGMTEHDSSPVMVMGDVTGTAMFQPIVTYSADSGEYVLFANVIDGSVQVKRFTSSDGLTWSGGSTVISDKLQGPLIKQKKTGEFFDRPRKSAGETWYLSVGANSSTKYFYSSTDDGKNWSQHAPVFEGSPESWEDGGILDVTPFNLPDGTWAVYYDGYSSSGSVDTRTKFGVAEAGNFPP